MAYDISIGDSAPSSVGLDSFEIFYTNHGETLASALALAAGEGHRSDTALSFSLSRAAQRWKQLQPRSDALAWAYAEGVAKIESEQADEPSEHVNEATGGYVRGLDLASAVASLPVSQRAALVAAYFLDWSDADLAAGLSTSAATVETRRRRATTFLDHHLSAGALVGEAETAQLVRAHFGQLAQTHTVKIPAVDKVRRSGRRRNLRNRLSGVAAAVVLIAGAAALFNLDVRETPAVEATETIDPPTASAEWFGPVSDGAGGYVALNTSGASLFAASGDGEEWLRAAVWNSRAVDLRSEVSGFYRSNGRYLATIESAPAIAGFVPPHIGVSTDLVNWDVFELDVGALSEVPGLRPEVEVLSVAAAGTKVLVIVGIGEVIDYRSFDIRANDVCVEQASPEGLTLHLCDGGAIEAPRLSSGRSGAPTTTRFLLSEGGRSFIEVAPLVTADPYELFSTADEFVMLDSETGALMSSIDGRSWSVPAAGPEAASRFLLAEGSTSGTTMVVRPDPTGWSSKLIGASDARVDAQIPLNLDPASIWIKPELVSGPAGWAMYVTTSRPWERTDSSPGFALDAGDWIVSQLPDSPVITARASESDVTFRYREGGEAVVREPDGAVTLFDPVSGEVLVNVTAAQIAQSRPRPEADSGAPKAYVLFSADGRNWETVWQTAEDTWAGTIAVGDNEVILSGSQLLGGPVTISLDS